MMRPGDNLGIFSFPGLDRRFLMPSMREGFPRYSPRLFSSFPTRYLHSAAVNGRWHLCNSILRASLEKGTPRTALLHFRSLLPSHFRPDHRTLSLVLEACRRTHDIHAAACAHARITKSAIAVPTSLFYFYLGANRIHEARQVLGEMPQTASDPTFPNLLMAGYLRIGHLENAREIFNSMPLRDLISWNSIIAGCAKLSHPREAVDAFRRMLAAGFIPDEFTFSVTLSACAKVGARSHGEWVHKLMLDLGVPLNYILTAALIDMYVKCGSIEKGKEIFDRVSRSNVSIWNAMLSGLAIHGLGHDAMEVFSRMEKEGMMPDSITFVALLTACSHNGLVRSGRCYFDIMKEKYNIEPLIEHYGAMVDLLARAGLLQEAYETMKMMPMAPDDAMWRSLLSASRIHRQPKMAEIVASEMADRGSGDYVLLSNIFSMSDRWSCAEKVWEEMKGNKIRKTRGLSWIELHGKVHEFKAGDRSHAESDDIHLLLRELTKRAKENGFTPMIGWVAMNVLEEEKEENLSGHSEKLAVTYGLLKLAPSSEIRVSKNLRACIDCHSWLKVVSSMLCRVIIVRDRIRFHRFEKGSCSCKDYW